MKSLQIENTIITIQNLSDELQKIINDGASYLSGLGDVEFISSLTFINGNIKSYKDDITTYYNKEKKSLDPKATKFKVNSSIKSTSSTTSQNSNTGKNSININTKEIENIILNLSSISNNFSLYLNIYDSVFPLTSNFISKCKQNQEVSKDIKKCYNYLEDVIYKMEQLDNKYFALDALNYESSKGKYDKRNISKAHSIVPSIIKKMDTEKWKYGGTIVSGISTVCIAGIKLFKNGIPKDGADIAKFGIKTVKSVLNIYGKVDYFILKNKYKPLVSIFKEGTLNGGNVIKNSGRNIGNNIANFKYADTLKTIGKIGTVLSIASTAVDNYKEYGGFSARMFAETVMEFAVEEGADFAIGLAASLIFPGFGPIVAIGAKTVIDMAFENATGESMTEFISDSALNIFEKLGPDSNRGGAFATNIEEYDPT